MASSSSTSLVDLDPDPAAVTQTVSVNGQHDYPTQLKDTAFLYDDCYSSLKNHFCTVGRGRRPPLPTLTAPTHRILAQLGILKDAESRTWEESLIPGIQENYVGLTKGKYQVDINIDEQNFLPADLIGGIVMTAQNGKISINNTLDERLKHIGRQMQPQIRGMLFGPNPNRTFND